MKFKEEIIKLRWGYQFSLRICKTKNCTKDVIGEHTRFTSIEINLYWFYFALISMDYIILIYCKPGSYWDFFKHICLVLCFTAFLLSNAYKCCVWNFIRFILIFLIDSSNGLLKCYFYLRNYCLFTLKYILIKIVILFVCLVQMFNSSKYAFFLL